MDEPIVVKPKPSAVVKPTSVPIPETEVVISSADSGQDTVNIQKQSEAIQETLQQCAKIATSDDVSALAKQISTLTQALTILLPQFVANNQQQLISSNQNQDRPISDSKYQNSSQACENVDRSHLQELIAKQLEKRKPTENVPVAPQPPPPPPPQQPNANPIQNAGLEMPIGVTELIKEDKAAEATPKGAMLEELNKKISSGLNMRQKPVEKKEPVEKSYEVDFKRVLKPAKVSANIPSPESAIIREAEEESAEKVTPLLAQIKANNLQRRQSMQAAKNTVEETSSEAKLPLKKTIRMPAGDVAQAKSQNDQDKFSLPFAFKLKRVLNKPAWCRESDDGIVGEATDHVDHTEMKHCSEPNSPIEVSESEQVSMVIQENVGKLSEKPSRVCTATMNENQTQSNATQTNIQFSEDIWSTEQLIKTPPTPPPPTSIPQSMKFEEPTTNKRENVNEKSGTGDNERGALLTAINDLDLNTLRNAETRIEVRDALLSAIKDFSKDRLKSLSNDTVPRKDSVPAALSLNSILQSALKDRFRACNGDAGGSEEENEDNDFSDTDEDEWYNAEE